MIHRLLRGWLPYVFFGVFIFSLYWRAVQVGSPRSFEMPEPPHATETSEWWPQGVDPMAMAQRVLQHPRLALLLSGLTFFIVGMALGGCWMMLWACWTGRIRSLWRFTSRRLPRWSFGELTRITLLILMVACLMPFVRVALLYYQPTWQLDTHLWVAVSMLLLDTCLILTVLVFAADKGRRRSPWHALGFSSRRAAPAIGMGLRGYLSVFPWLFLLLFLVAQVARAFGWEPPVEPIHELIFEEHRPMVLLLTSVLACAVGPIAEELFFRGVVYTALRQRLSRLVAILISGVIFALIHANPMGFLPIMVLGCLLAYLYERTGSLASPLAIHIVHNTFLMILAMAFRRLMVLT